MLHPCRRWGSSSLPSRGEDPHGHGKNHPYFVFELTLTDLGNTFPQVSDYPLPSDSSRPRPRKKPSGGSSSSRWGNSRERDREAATATANGGIWPLSLRSIATAADDGEAAPFLQGEKILTATATEKSTHILYLNLRLRI